jgi:hypothetical protein
VLSKHGDAKSLPGVRQTNNRAPHRQAIEQKFAASQTCTLSKKNQAPCGAEVGDFLQACAKSLRIRHIVAGTCQQPLFLLVGQLPHRLGRAAQDHAAIRKFLALGDQGTRSYQAPFANASAIEHDGTNADQGTISNRATMQHDLVTHGDVLANRERFADVCMQHTGILDIGARPDADGFRAARTTAPNHMLASAPISTAPMTSALSANRSPLIPRVGDTPSNSLDLP